jgi:hypothetical protein
MSARLHAFGLTVEADFQLAGSGPEEEPFQPDVRLALESLEGRWSGPAGPPPLDCADRRL